MHPFNTVSTAVAGTLGSSREAPYHQYRASAEQLACYGLPAEANHSYRRYRD